MRSDIKPTDSLECVIGDFIVALRDMQNNVFVKENIRFVYKLDDGSDDLENYQTEQVVDLNEKNILAIGKVVYGAMNALKDEGHTWRDDQIKQPATNKIFDKKSGGDPDERLAAGTLLRLFRTAQFYRDKFPHRFKGNTDRRQEAEGYSGICAKFLDSFDVCLVTTAHAIRQQEPVNA